MFSTNSLLLCLKLFVFFLQLLDAAFQYRYLLGKLLALSQQILLCWPLLLFNNHISHNVLHLVELALVGVTFFRKTFNFVLALQNTVRYHFYL